VNLTLFQKALALVALPVVALGGFVLATARFLDDHLAAWQLSAHTKEVIAQGYEVQTLVFDAQAAIRGAVIIGDPAIAAHFHNTHRELARRLDELEGLVSDNPAQLSQVRTVRAAAAAVTTFQVELDRLIRVGAADQAAALIRTRRGEQLVADFRREVSAFLAEEQQLDQDRVDVLERSRQNFVALLVAGGVLGLGSTLGVGIGFRRGITRRFATLEANAVRLAAGLPALPLPGRGADEITRIDLACRKLAADLTETSDRVRDLYDNAPCGYHSVDPAGTLVAVNQTEARWLGYTPADLLGRVRFADLVHPGSRDKYQWAFARVRESGSVADVELELLRKDGATFPVLLNSSAIRSADGSYARSRTILTDLTERRQAEAAVRLFADVAHRIPTGLLIVQLDGGDPPVLRIRSGNRESKQLLGIAVDEAAGQPLVSVFPQVPPDMLRRYTAVAATGREDDLGELRYGDDRVAERWWSVVAFPLPDRSAGIAFHDVTARKAAEAEVRQLTAGLEARVRERTAELESVNRDLAQKNAENEMFVYSVSHDLRSPLVNLQGFSRELEKAGRGLVELLAGDGVPDEVRTRGRDLIDRKVAKAIGFIQTAVLRLSGIIDALLRLSRAGRVEYRWEAVDVAGVVGRVVEAAQGTVAERGAAVRVGPLPPAWGDRTAVEQVFGNLFGNALAYLDPARPGEVEVGALPAEAGGGHTYFVRDNGLGIAEAHQARIFQAFQRAHPGVGAGEGLGLAIVARVVERHRGRVWVESRPGAGSTFFVNLPVPPAGNGR
jgi:PAS domain S-box-containing protein